MSTENTLPAKPAPSLGNMKKVVSAIAIDTFFWSYALLVSHKILYEKVIMNVRYPEFSWNQPLSALGIGFAVSLLLFFTSVSLGRAFQGLYEFDENESKLNKPFALWG